MPEIRTIDVEDDGARLDRWFRRHYPAVTHTLLEKLLRKDNGLVRPETFAIRSESAAILVFEASVGLHNSRGPPSIPKV